MTNYSAALTSWIVGGAYCSLDECFEDDIEGLGRGVWEKARSFWKSIWLTDGSRTDGSRCRGWRTQTPGNRVSVSFCTSGKVGVSSPDGGERHSCV